MSLYVDIEKKLNNFCLQVKFEAGNHVFSLLGASGCGKSMTLKCIAGIEKPDRGRIILDGRTLFDSEKQIDLPPQKRRAGYLFQQCALFPNMTAEQNIACGVRDKTRRTAAVREIMEMMHLNGLEKKKPAQLSGGEQQRTALARILVNEPEVLLLDEPFSALDAHLRFRLEQELRNVIRRFGKTVLFVSHDRDEVFRLSSEIAVMKNGRLETIGTKHEVFAAPLTVSGATLTGCKNISPIRRIDASHVYAQSWGVTLKVNGDTDGVTHIGIRMHDVAAVDNTEGENTFLCQVTEEIENPFSITAMLRPFPKTGSSCEEIAGLIGMELPKSDWARIRRRTLPVVLPAKAILLLK